MSSIFLSSLLACHRKRKVKKKRNTNKPHINNSLKASAKFCKCLQTALTEELYRSQTCTARKQVPLGPNLAHPLFLWPSGYKALIYSWEQNNPRSEAGCSETKQRGSTAGSWGWCGDAAGHVLGQPDIPWDDWGRKAALHPPVPTSNLLCKQGTAVGMQTIKRNLCMLII